MSRKDDLRELEWLYMELYDDREAYEYFMQMLEQNRRERRPSLRRLDEERVRQSGEQSGADAWYQSNQLLGMMLYVQNFGGDLKGVLRNLPYIEECGVNYLHLMPLLDSSKGKSDGGYAVSDFRKVRPSLGTMEDLERLADACHEKGISLCLDFVLNHTSEDHVWAREARKGDPQAMARYFFYDNWDIPGQFEQTVPQVFPTTAPGNFTWLDDMGKIVMTSFHHYQWDLNYANPMVFNDMTDNLLYLINRGMDVIRLDAIPYIWKQLGTNCRNLLRVHTLVRIMRMAAEVVCPGTLLLGEVVMEPSKVVPYFGSVEKPECHILYNVTTMATTWHTVATKDVRLLRHQLGTVFALPKEYTFLNYLRCHDDIGWGLDYPFLRQFGIEEVAHKKFLNDYFRGLGYESDARGELYNDDPRLGDARLCGTTASLCGIEAALYEKDEEKLEKALRLDIMLHAFLFTQSGIPVLYSGDEIAQENDYTYHDDPLKAEDSRYLHRGSLDWKLTKKRKNKKTVQGRMFQAVKTFEKLRLAHPVFRDEADVWLVETWNDHVLGIGRYYEGEKLIALFNFGDGDEVAWVNEPEDYIDLITGKERPAKGVEIPANGFAWLLTCFGKKKGR